MGFRQTLRDIWTGDSEALYRASLPSTDLQPVASGSSAVDLPADVAAAFGVNIESERVTRAQAQSIPAVRRARAIVCGALGTMAFVPTRLNAEGRVERITSGSAAKLLSQLDPMATPQWTKTWTVDDLWHYGIAWWFVTDRDASTDYPIAVRRLLPGSVRVQHGRVYINGRQLPADQERNLIRFDAPDEGLLAHSGSLRTCLELERQARLAAGGQPPQDYLRPAEGAPELGDTEVDELLAAWDEGRRTRTTAWLNRAVEHGVVGWDPRARQLIESRQYQAAEVARLANLDPGRLGAPSGSSRTYTTTEGERRDLVDVTLRPFMVAFQERLSMPDVTPGGTSVLVDALPYLRGTTSDAITAGREAVDGGLMSAEEVRVDLLGRPASPELGQLRQPAPAVTMPAAD